MGVVKLDGMGYFLVLCRKVNSIGLDVVGVESNMLIFFFELCGVGMYEELYCVIIVDGFLVFMEFGCGVVCE